MDGSIANHPSPIRTCGLRSRRQGGGGYCCCNCTIPRVELFGQQLRGFGSTRSAGCVHYCSPCRGSRTVIVTLVFVLLSGLDRTLVDRTGLTAKSVAKVFARVTRVLPGFVFFVCFGELCTSKVQNIIIQYGAARKQQRT